MLNLSISESDLKLVNQIAQRATQVAVSHRAISLLKAFSKVEEARFHREVLMDVWIVHANGCPLRLQELLDAEPYEFAHDVFEMRERLDRVTGQLTGCFVPRFSVDLAAHDFRIHLSQESEQ
jgi:hypothetical protein